MTRLSLSYCLLLFLIISCSAEKINLSPVGDLGSKSQDAATIYTPTQKKNLIFYSSEITNLIASFPKFKNDAVNKEILNLKIHLKDYISAMQVYDVKNLDKAEKQFESSYKKLQKISFVFSTVGFYNFIKTCSFDPCSSHCFICGYFA